MESPWLSESPCPSKEKETSRVSNLVMVSYTSGLSKVVFRKETHLLSREFPVSSVALSKET